MIVRVADNGPGVPPQHAERIFQPFFTLKDQQGSGLGLPISASLAVRMGERAPRDTGAGRPLRPAAAHRRARLRSVRPVPVRARARDTDRILLVDDEPRVLDVIEQLLHPAAVTRARLRGGGPSGVGPRLRSRPVRSRHAGGDRPRLPQLARPSTLEALERFVLMTGSAVGMEDAVAALPAQQRPEQAPQAVGAAPAARGAAAGLSPTGAHPSRSRRGNSTWGWAATAVRIAPEGPAARGDP